ncbi:hypothetical protein HN018_26060 (plasmid) [Lichenicola cladoniae]|uniref:Uncharacterized protein n=1 Tax=Lichenicola cladoniae TaxID=1484109 RepID=A0A6M8HZ56_9PROT|nr:hypothetical protein [Lichenicola cladoniae]NPD70007.1 hypothetical protein [Acetobacteraceae bacterium]QKE93628.1 hypothetical protein HN018_26060 [Lichenicola cladoniae]
MQVSDSTELSPSPTPIPDTPRPHRKPGTIPVTVRLDPFRYDRLKRLVLRFSTTGQNIIQTALDRSMVSLERERERASQAESAGQSTLFEPAINIQTNVARKAKQDSFAFIRPEPTVALTYRATVPMHRWLHHRAADTGMTIQDIINDALKAARDKG